MRHQHQKKPKTRKNPPPKGRGAKWGRQHTRRALLPSGDIFRSCPGLALLAHVSCNMSGHVGEDQMSLKSGAQTCSEAAGPWMDGPTTFMFLLGWEIRPQQILPQGPLSLPWKGPRCTSPPWATVLQGEP